MSRTTEEIQQLYRQRKQRLDPMHQRALEVRSAYYGDITLPVPEIDSNEKPLVANFIFESGEQKAQRVASTMPNVYYPSTRPGIQSADQRARDRRLINMAWWDRNRMKLKMRQRARHMVYYASQAVMLRPHLQESRPEWCVRNPLSALPPEMEVGQFVPEDIIFTFTKPLAWLEACYPNQMHYFGINADTQDGFVTLIEYQDADENVLIASGEKVEPSRQPFGQEIRSEVAVELERTPNRIGHCTAVIHGGIGLDHARGYYDGTIGMWQAMARLMALEVIGMQRSIWKETWLVDDPNSDGAKVVQYADPVRGILGHVSGGKIETIAPEPSAFAPQIIDRLERFIRIEGAVPAELGGESTSNIRTGRRGDQILSSVLDFPIQEMQEILAVALQEENRIAVAIDKAYFPTKKTVYVSATAGQIDYEANTTFENDVNFVAYSHAGVDAQGLVIELGQMVGTGLISRRSAMESHPLIEDAQSEFDRIGIERVRDALLTGLQQLASDPNMAPIIAKIAKTYTFSGENEIEDAVLQVHEEMQTMQAAQAQQQAPGMPGAPPGPEAQPGMAAPPGAPPAEIQAPPQSLTNLTALLTQLRRGSRAGVPNQLGIAS
jgi:hypothetical protein